MAAPADEEPEPGVLPAEQLEAALHLLTREHHCRYLLSASLEAKSALPLSCSFETWRVLEREIMRCCVELADILGELLSLEMCVFQMEEHDDAPVITGAR